MDISVKVKFKQYSTYSRRFASDEIEDVNKTGHCQYQRHMKEKQTTQSDPAMQDFDTAAVWDRNQNIGNMCKLVRMTLTMLLL